MKKIIGLLLITSSIMSCDCGKKKVEKELSLSEEIYRNMEKAYFEGQQDAINGDIRITLKSDCYVWSKSPWDSGRLPIYNPTKEDTKIVKRDSIIEPIIETEDKVHCTYCNSTDIIVKRCTCNNCKRTFNNK